jgi:glycosyltransferase involved in cell wall biosynthesis
MSANNLRFIIIICFYNARDYIRECIDSVLMQTHSNWLAVCMDDHSDDGSSTLLPDDPRLIKRFNENRLLALQNIYNAIVNSGIEYTGDDVICILDGDDKFLHPFALEIVQNYFRESPSCLLTFGQFITSFGRLGHCRPYSEWEFQQLRKTDYRASHLKAFKWTLYQEFLNQDRDLNSYKDSHGNFFSMTYDLALMLPLMEIAGFGNIRFNKHPIYWYRKYNRNDSTENGPLQKQIDLLVRSKPKFKQAFSSPPGSKPRIYYALRRIYWRIKEILLSAKQVDKRAKERVSISIK